MTILFLESVFTKLGIQPCLPVKTLGIVSFWFTLSWNLGIVHPSTHVEKIAAKKSLLISLLHMQWSIKFKKKQARQSGQNLGLFQCSDLGDIDTGSHQKACWQIS